MQKTFLLGLGAQKAGTTWVHSYLKKHPECASSAVKELSVLTNYFSPDRAFTNQILNKISALEDALKSYRWRTNKQKINAAADQQLLYMLDYLAADHDLKYYMSYFNRLVNNTPDAKVVSDITPAYCMLTVENLEQTKQALEAEGYRVRTLFLMRDPVERCFSALRMGVRNSATPDQVEEATQDFFRSATADWCQVRTRYEDIVPRIETVFGAENCLFDFYETFISEPGVQRLCQFLDISYVAPNLEHKANASPRSEEPDRDEWEQVRQTYRDTYAFCEEKFGKDVVSRAWGDQP